MHRASLILAAVVMAAAGGAVACEGKKVLYEDHFAAPKLDASWGTFGDELTLEKGRLVIRPEPAMVYLQTNDLAMRGDVDLCADVTIVDGVAADEVLAGLIFWYVDDDNLYALELDAAGHAAIWRRKGGDWNEVVPWSESDLVAPGDAKTNHLRVATRDKTATIYVNGMKLVEVTTDTLPGDGQMVGLIAGSAGTGVSTIAFDEFKVTAPD
jgi:hypothetical protein